MKNWSLRALQGVLLLSLIVAIGQACKCKTSTPSESFCRAHWVARTKVLLRQTKQRLPAGFERKGLNNIRYTVHFLNVYKKPLNVSILPPEIYTPSEPPACGLLIEPGKEYLLAGRIENGFPTTVLCGQVLPDDASLPAYVNVLEWSRVTPALVSSLSSGQLGKNC